MNLKTTLLTLGVVLSTSVFATQYEAETASLTEGATKVTDASASGGAYVDQKEGNITFSVSVESDGKYEMKIHYKAGDKKTNYVAVNGSQVGQVDFSPSSSFTDAITFVTLKAGENTIGINKFWGWISVDYIDIIPYQSKPFTICNAPITPNATPEAIKLYNFLVNNFGKKTISGIMTGDMDGYTLNGDVKTHPDVSNIFERSGKYPALVGVDFLFANGPNESNSWYKEYTDKAVALAKDLWKKGGIPAFTWHWKDPSDSVDAFYANQNSAGAGKEYTTFKFSNAFMTGTTTWDTLSQEYKGIIADIDHIADYFIALQKENVAAIFRPLHEAGGDWFWWSTQKGKEFAALYRLVYERMVFIKGVKNLIWVFNPQSASLSDWNPGEAYYDILSIDIYNNDNDHSSNSAAFDDFKAKFGLSKILALSENGPIPDIDNMVSDETIWSWWMPWYGTWSGKWPGQTSNEIWKKNMEDPRVITLEDMPSWDSYNENINSTNVCAVAKVSSVFNADVEKASGNKKEDKMVVTLDLNNAGALINTTKLPDLTKSKSISVDIQVNGSGTTDGGIWIGLAFVRDGSKDEAWTWEQSPSDGCWIDENGGAKNCTFDITTYSDSSGVHPIDLDKLFSLVFNFSAEGFKGTVTFDNLVTDDGIMISSFDDAKSLFSISDESKESVKSIKLASENSTNLIQVSKNNSSNFTIKGNNIMLTTNKTGNINIDVFNINGKFVTKLYNGNLDSGSYSFNMDNLPKGNFIIRIKGSGLIATQPIVIK